MNLKQRYEQARTELRRHGQGHLLRFWEELSESQRGQLLDDIERIDFEQLAPLIDSHVRAAPQVELPEEIRPPDILPHQPANDTMARRYARAARLGAEMIAAGKVALLTVAGGQGSRLGFDGPKGALPVSPVRGKTLFQLFAEQARNAQARHGVTLTWLIMTSPTNDAPTRAFFEANGHFGLRADQIVFFTQGVMPAVDLDGRILLADRGRVALSPDGHGGTLRAIHHSGALRRIAEAGVEVLSYFQVDNPLIHPIDELFIGLHAQDRAQLSCKTIPKSGPLERVGNFCVADDRLIVIEYSDLPDELAHQVDAGGRRVFDAGSIAIHLFDVAFVAELNRGGFGLPFHRAAKRVPSVDSAGRLIDPEQPNAIKLETFVFDALPLAQRTLLWQTRREEEFAPVKNATGADSLATAQAAMVERAARWLESAGAAVPRKADGSPDAAIEISPLLADSAEQLAEAIDPAAVRIAPGGEVYLPGPGEGDG